MNEVIVIGSGPAGCAAAITCMRNGLTVTIVAGRGRQRRAMASESIHPGVESLLQNLGIPNAVGHARKGSYAAISTGGNRSMLGADESGEWLGSHIDRAAFDECLLNGAIQSGAMVVRENVVDLIVHEKRVNGVRLANGTFMNSIFVIDASGPARVGGRRAGFTDEFFSPPLVVSTGTAEGPTFHFDTSRAEFNPEPNGWSWIAPETGQRCTWTRLTVKGGRDITPPSQLAGLNTVGDTKTINRRWRISRPLCTEGLILCGDAAGYLDPAAGQGILNAIYSGTVAAKTVKNILNDRRMEAFHLSAYDDWFYRNYLSNVEKLKAFYSMHGIVLWD